MTDSDIPKAILHIDGDSFFASCEVSLNHKLRGKPVVTGSERGIASAMSKEAKALGVTRGMPVFQVRKLFPEVIVLSSDYGMYELFAQRMFAIVRRYTDCVEEYSIDECFALLDEWKPDTVSQIKSDLQNELGMTFSLGLAPTKVLAKLASSQNKPDGLTILNTDGVNAFLKAVDIGKVWGIGGAISQKLRKMGIVTALDLKQQTEVWGRDNLDKPIMEIWYELNGVSLLKVSPSGEGGSQRSIQATKSFKPPTVDKNFLLSELSKNIENACVKARANKLVANKISYFLKSQEFRYYRTEMPLSNSLSTPADIISLVRSTLDSVYAPNLLYRATGVTLSGLVPRTKSQEDLFGNTAHNSRWDDIFETVDNLDKRYGSHSVVLASSLRSYRRSGKTGFYKRLNIPYMGEVN